MKKKLILVLLSVCSLVFVDKVNATTINVCKNGCTYSTIKSAYENSNAGDTIYIKEGTYEEETITIDKKINLKGENNQVVIKSPSDKYLFEIKGVQELVAISNITIKDSYGGINIVSSTNVEIININVTNITKYGIYAENSKVKITGGTITNAGTFNEDETGFTSISLNEETEGTISGVTITGAKYRGITVSNTTKPIIIKDVTIKDSYVGINIVSSTNVEIININATNITKCGIYVENSKVKITGGTITNAGTLNEDGISGSPSIYLKEETEGTISGVTITGAKLGGIAVSNTTKPIIIKDVTIKDSYLGINIETSTNVEITNLIATDITRHAVYAESSKVKITGGTITNAGTLNEDETCFSSISLNEETEGTISGVTITGAKYRGITVSNTTKPIIIKDVTIKDSYQGLEINNSSVQANDFYIVNTEDFAIKTIENGKIILKNSNSFKDDYYEFLGYSDDEMCGNYIEDSNYSNDGDIELSSCFKKIEKVINEDIKEDIENPETGDFIIFLVILFGLLASIGSIYYFKRIKKNKEVKI